MKIVIWIFCIILANAIVALLNAIIGNIGIAPAIPIYAIIFWFARFLCRKWDEKHP